LESHPFHCKPGGKKKAEPGKSEGRPTGKPKKRSLVEEITTPRNGGPEAKCPHNQQAEKKACAQLKEKMCDTPLQKEADQRDKSLGADTRDHTKDKLLCCRTLDKR